jgi:hypothetical protein
LIATASIIPAIATGYFTWWINYELRDSPTIVKKRRLAWITLALAMLAVVARTFWIQDAVDFRVPSVLIYAGALWGIAVLASCVGFLGGKLVFPYDHH